MASFLTAEQRQLAEEIAALLTARGETVTVAESTAGGLISAALLWVPGASRYFAGGAVVYTLDSRVALAGVTPESVANYQGTTPEMLLEMAASLRQRLAATWCIAESGLAGPGPGRTGRPPGRAVLGVSGPVSRSDVIETGIDDREENMVRFTTAALVLMRDALQQASTQT
jgi:nicotinamide-nucleotide amidase